MQKFNILKTIIFTAASVAISCALAVLCVLKFGFNLNAGIILLIFINLTLISFSDITRQIIPDWLIIILAALSIIQAFLFRDVTILERIIGFFVLSIPMLTLTYFIEDSFGGGDIKLIAVCGLLLGFKLVLLSGIIAILLGGFHGFVIKYILKKKDEHFPFGQHICLGVFISTLFGSEIIQWYLG